MMLRVFVPLLVTLIASMQVQAAAPSLGSITPRGGQRGTEMTIFFNGGNLADAQEILFYNPGVTVKKLEVVNPSQVKVTAAIAPDCRLGEHNFRVRCASGISEVRTFWIGALASETEKEPNTEFAAAQKIAMNVTVHGVVDNEDVDYFAFDVKKGQRISVEVEAMRLGTTLFDPYVAILDSKRFELATSDDSPMIKQDSMCSVIAPEDGTYYVMIRESAYGGNGACNYRLHIGTFPRPTAVVPAGGKFGEEIEVTFLGDPSGPIKQKVKLPATDDPNFRLHAVDAGGISPSAIPFRLSEFPNTIEVEPNPAHAQATTGVIPGAFNGVLSEVGDIDCFRFAGKKGQVYDVHCYARRIGSQLDPVMTLSVFNGGAIVANDDSAGPDSFFRVTLPNDGEYVLQVNDHLGKGGVNYHYRVEFTPVVPKLALGVPKSAQYSQERQAFAVPRGNRFATLVSASRVDFGGDLVVQPGALPEKVTLATENMIGSMTLVPMVFEAAPDAPIGAKLTPFFGKHVDPNVKLQSSFKQDAELIIGNPGQSIYWAANMDQAVIGVTEAVPFKISIVQPKVPLVHNGSMALKVVAERQAGFKAPITVSMLYNPPGVGSATNVTIPEGQNEITLPLNANGGAPVRTWKIAVMGTATHNGGPVWVSSQLADLVIAPPYVTFAMERGAVEQGKPTQMFCKITVNTPFTGNAKVSLLGLPAKVATKEMEFNKDTKEIAFALTTEATTPAGIHRNIFCQVLIPENGDLIPHTVGGTELRVDVPLPPKPNAPPPPPMPMPMPMPMAQPMPMPMAPPMKRLSRLEQLRLEQQEREKALQNPAPKK
ncbi:PPC domain-containing protein [Tuwongella immobilis]|uniref:Peptidase C-terminal archaeal/bacterial domain-containing protein n=1 Tax=Tuwongella immobilis TaxID=692036 RepID=A0A6C2YSK4_9BACT|nr:PPC domain-containing protein [Tuwongella immobilis]VIP04123.1 Probable serine proteinase, subtilase family OS=Planctomyces maris DSM 8797 GN=PM8797T_03955 PE=4 SV=1: PPC [Tuwongella immobilis]VTS05611.1 Probable serine proteinase, subtilase family OS=Planctomyces maris DSM 8797 GN=PM8797T_03955 PE=4 SV=1: PPC [Tuwongella immobilis]